jgi:signal transduction histidine kinase
VAARLRAPAPGAQSGDRLLGIRLVDVAILALVIAIMELNVVVGGGYGASPLDAEAYILGAVIALPVLLRRRWPLQVLLVCFVLIMFYYAVDRRNISPAPLLCIPVYDAAVNGYLAWAIAIPAIVMSTGALAIGLSGAESVVTLGADFLPSVVVFVLAVALGEVVRSRRALHAETASRLRLAEEERQAEAGRLVAEERLRIARELHDTVAHSMATITVQAGSALHLLTGHGKSAAAADDTDAGALHDALIAIRETSKGALGEMRTVLGQMRDRPAGPEPSQQAGENGGTWGLDRLPALREAVTAAGSPVRVSVEGEQAALPPDVDHAAYRILQESLTNVLRHAAPGTPADVCLRYGPDAVTIRVANKTDPGHGAAAGNGAGGESGTGNGIRGMRERAAAIGGELVAGPCPGGGFEVTATLPRQVPS